MLSTVSEVLLTMTYFRCSPSHGHFPSTWLVVRIVRKIPWHSKISNLEVSRGEQWWGGEGRKLCMAFVSSFAATIQYFWSNAHYDWMLTADKRLATAIEAKNPKIVGIFSRELIGWGWELHIWEIIRAYENLTMETNFQRHFFRLFSMWVLVTRITKISQDQQSEVIGLHVLFC